MGALVCNAAYSEAPSLCKYRNHPLFPPVAVTSAVSDFPNHLCVLTCTFRGTGRLIYAFCWPARSSRRGRWLPPSSFLHFQLILEQLVVNQTRRLILQQL